jgi:hypothetical protein
MFILIHNFIIQRFFLSEQTTQSQTSHPKSLKHQKSAKIKENMFLEMFFFLLYLRYIRAANLFIDSFDFVSKKFYEKKKFSDVLCLYLKQNS